MLISNKTEGFHKNILFNLLNELGYTDIEDFQKKNSLVSDGLFGMKSYETLYNLLLKVQSLSFENYYFKVEFAKNQIIWHHSAGWDDARGMFSWWQKDGATHVATAIGITDDGVVTRGFDESYWAASIGCKAEVFAKNGVQLKYRKDRNGRFFASNNIELDERAVAVEICNWGSLTEKDGKFFSWANAEVPKEKVISIDYKGFKHFEAYTDAEIKSLKYWTLLNAMRFQIPLDFSYDDMFGVSKKALSGQKGLFTHNSYRFDKNDVAPQPKLVEMAKTLQEYQKASKWQA